MLTRDELLKDVFVGEWSDEDIRYVILKMLPNIKSQESLIKWTFYHYADDEGYSCNHKDWGGGVGMHGATLEKLHQNLYDDILCLTEEKKQKIEEEIASEIITRKFNINHYGNKISP